MKIEILISLLGALTAVIVSVIGAFLANRNSIILQIRKRKEEGYTTFLEALHENAANRKSGLRDYVLARDKLFIIASEEVIFKLLDYEEKGIMGKTPMDHDKYLTELIKAIRKDLKLKDKRFPLIGLKKDGAIS